VKRTIKIIVALADIALLTVAIWAIAPFVAIWIILGGNKK